MIPAPSPAVNDAAFKPAPVPRVKVLFAILTFCSVTAALNRTLPLRTILPTLPDNDVIPVNNSPAPSWIVPLFEIVFVITKLSASTFNVPPITDKLS